MLILARAAIYLSVDPVNIDTQLPKEGERNICMTLLRDDGEYDPLHEAKHHVAECPYSAMNLTLSVHPYSAVFLLHGMVTHLLRAALPRNGAATPPAEEAVAADAAPLQCQLANDRIWGVL